MPEQLTTIAFLGPTGTYSGDAAQRFASRLGLAEFEAIPLPSFNAVFNAVEQGEAEYGVVASENSIEGSVTSVLDELAARTDVQILGDTVVDINHCLMIHPDAALEDIQVIYSHAQGLAQCRHYLDTAFPTVQRITAASTAESARKAGLDIHAAAIANKSAAAIHGCRILEESVEDHKGNQTRFYLIGAKTHKPVFTGNQMKTSLQLSMWTNKPGALLMILSEFSYANLNLSKIQSRPTKKMLGEYLFFIDVDAALDDEVLQTALACLRLKLREVKVLGSYPVEENDRAPQY